MAELSPLTSMWYHINRLHSDELRRYTRPVADIRTPPSSSCVFRHKADGEVVYCIDGGSVWVVCRTDRNRTVLGYHVKSSISNYFDKPTVIRCKLMPDGTLFLIDVVSISGTFLPIARPHDDSELLLVSSRTELPSIVTWPLYDTYESCYAAIGDTDYPVDGVIAIETSTSLSYRIKQHTTIDLLATGDGLCYVSSTGQYLPALSLSTEMEIGDIYECQVRLDSASTLLIERYHARYDKEVPNNKVVYNSVIDMLSSSDSADKSLYCRISHYSYLLRTQLYHYAYNLLRL
ncbi:hypothetical protein HDU78_011369, partial [Chytriomyces hyalinus]